jgi:hypothetical protein
MDVIIFNTCSVCVCVCVCVLCVCVCVCARKGINPNKHIVIRVVGIGVLHCKQNAFAPPSRSRWTVMSNSVSRPQTTLPRRAVTAPLRDASSLTIPTVTATLGHDDGTAVRYARTISCEICVSTAATNFQLPNHMPPIAALFITTITATSITTSACLSVGMAAAHAT